MQLKNEEELILSLIKDDLINTKLVNSLTAMGLQADNYLLHLTDTIFTLMGFTGNREREIALERYMELAKGAMLVDIAAGHQPMDALAYEIYTGLLCPKNK
jgi:hypothetical protein